MGGQDNPIADLTGFYNIFNIFSLFAALLLSIFSLGNIWKITHLRISHNQLFFPDLATQT